MTHDSTYPCPQCGIGLCHSATITYTEIYGDKLLSVPQVAAFACDVCDYQELTDEALEWLDNMIGRPGAEDDDSADDYRPAGRGVFPDVPDGSSPQNPRR